MNHIERIECSGDTTKDAERFCESIEMREVDEATVLFNEQPYSIKNNIRENFFIFDNENNIVELKSL